MNIRENVRDIEQSSKFEGHAGNRFMRRRVALLYLVSLDGFTDEWTGDVETFGYFERIGRHILDHDNFGFVSVTSYQTEVEAVEAFQTLDREYAELENEEDIDT